MKSIQCQHCEQYFEGETKEATQWAMLPHYKEVHADVMATNTEEDKKAWMAEFDRRWSATE